jgi:hypothetical protein
MFGAGLRNKIILLNIANVCLRPEGQFPIVSLEFFIGLILALFQNQVLTEISTTDIFLGGKGGRCVEPVAYRGGFGCSTPLLPRNFEVLTKLSRIVSSVENTSVTA